MRSSECGKPLRGCEGPSPGVCVRSVRREGTAGGAAAHELAFSHTDGDLSVQMGSPPLASGYHRLSVPLDPDDPSAPAVLSGLGTCGTDWYLYDMVGGRYYRYPDPHCRDMICGRGVWVRVISGGDITVEGMPASAL